MWTLFTTGLDLITAQTPETLVLQPEDQNISVPMTIIADSIIEVKEQFLLHLTIPTSTARYKHGTYTSTIVYIIDNDGGLKALGGVRLSKQK